MGWLRLSLAEAEMEKTPVCLQWFQQKLWFRNIKEMIRIRNRSVLTDPNNITGHRASFGAVVHYKRGPYYRRINAHHLFINQHYWVSKCGEIHIEIHSVVVVMYIGYVRFFPNQVSYFRYKLCGICQRSRWCFIVNEVFIDEDFCPQQVTP